MKAKLAIALALVVALVLGLSYWMGQQKTARLVAASVPDIPSDGISHPRLQERIQNATTQANEGSIEGLAELSKLYDANGFTNEAWQCYATLVVVEPQDPLWHYRFGRLLAGYGKLEEATPLFERTIDLDPDYIPARIRLGDTLLKQNRIEEAEAVYRKTLSLDKKNAYASVGLGRVEIARENWSGAKTHLEKATADSNFQIGADLLGDVYEKLGLERQEYQVLETIRWGSYADIPDPWSLDLINDCYDAYQVSIAGGWVVHQGDSRAGLRYLKRAESLDPDNSTIHFQMAGVYMQMSDLEEAERHYQRCVELEPGLADAWLGLMNIAERRQSPTTRRRLLDAALRAAPRSPSLQIEKGKLMLQQNRVDEAIAAFNRSIELRPHEAIGYVELAKAYMSLGRDEEGIEQIKRAIEKEPNNAIAVSTMAYHSIMNGNQSEAVRWLKRLGELPRVGRDHLNQLENAYRRVFGSAP
ncbi:tetratricopeptide repeat protein [Pelagicoccus sp. SDUM812003]|uniref:tetratricopeptide repeat protein n=1 Tax=Pelagicoccus sp. SDUM812003 TaxID=3041267 RepID=UPI00280F6895|nr:tetratricopeptide repeat protein [Pelagicoccus sp. SDUM812003]MDQ8202472.1 tetratricopeptide repeat protein [Pelagicoccus sp. SDUM812003]